MVRTVPRNPAINPAINPARAAPAICAAAFLLRLAGIAFAPDHFRAYTVYYAMGQTLAGGGGWCLSPGESCGYFPPVYPAVLAAGILTGFPGPAIAVFGALAGAGTVWFVWRIACHLFGPKAGLIAATCAALYPYFIWHDAVIQETGVLTFVVTAAIFLLIAGSMTGIRLWLITGATLALAVLTKANLLLFVPCVLLWLVFVAGALRPGLLATRAFPPLRA